MIKVDFNNSRTRKVIYFCILFFITITGYVKPAISGELEPEVFGNILNVFFPIAGFLVWFIAIQLFEMYFRITKNTKDSFLQFFRFSKPFKLYRDYYNQNGRRIDGLIIINITSYILLVVAFFCFVVLISV